MDFLLPIPAGMNYVTVVNRTGYALHRDQHATQQSFVRRLGSYDYPRFHVYIQKLDDQGVHCSIHLDMKKPTYIRGHAHNGEYDGEQVEREVQRIRGSARLSSTA